MAAFKNNGALLLVIVLSSLFLNSAFAHDFPSPAEAPSAYDPPSPTAAPTVDVPPSTISAPTVAEVDQSPSPSPSTAASKPVLASPPTPVSFISSSPDGSPASAPSHPPSASSPPSSSPSPSFTSSSEIVGEIYGILETSITAPIDVPAVGKDVQAQVSKVVQTSVIAVKSQTEQFMKNVIAKRLKDPETADATRECLSQCKENYDDANDDISKVMDDLSTGDYYKAMVDVEGISTFVDTCYDCLHEMVGDEPEFKKFDDWVKGVTGDCLEQLDKINS